MKRSKAVGTNDSSVPASKKAKGNPDITGAEWATHGKPIGKTPPLLVRGMQLTAKERVAGFDIDFTIIKTKSGKRFSTGPNDWEFLYPCIPAKLKALHERGTKIVFFTNQAGIEKGKTSVESLKQKVEGIVAALGIPVQVFVSTGENHYRKPSSRMWTFMEEQCNGGVTVDRSKSLYVGDAAGRTANWKQGAKKDFSCSDRMFAANVGVGFHTEEEFFLDKAPCQAFQMGPISPSKILEEGSKRSLPDNLTSKTQELVVLVGMPASGKSSLTKRYFEPKGYVRINQDTLKTKEKCLKKAEEALKEGKSVTVDNTNRDRQIRAQYVALSKRCKVPVRCFHLDVPQDVARHMNYFRQNQSEGEERRVPDVAYRGFAGSFQPPTKEEGFADVQTIQFVPCFDSAADEKLFRQWQV